MVRKLPDARALSDLLTSLLGRTAHAKPSPRPAALSAGKLALGTYCSDDGLLSAACVSDLRLACFVGACLTLVPAGVAASSAAEGTLPPQLQENFAEVLNILARLINDGGQPHVVFKDLSVAMPPLTNDAAALLAGPRVDFEVTVEGYGKGSLAFAG